LRNELANCRTRIESLEFEKASLEHSVKAGQVQKEIFYDETDKIQNVQQQEIMKLKSMLLFREQV
jgi:golgin subfamily A member 1